MFIFTLWSSIYWYEQSNYLNTRLGRVDRGANVSPESEIFNAIVKNITRWLSDDDDDHYYYNLLTTIIPREA